MTNRDNETWIAELRGEQGRQQQEAAFQDLGNALLPLIRWYLSNDENLPKKLSPSSFREREQLAQDIVQDALVSIWQRGLDLYRGEAKFMTFAKVVAINQAKQKLRRVWRRGEERWSSFDDDARDQEDDERLSLAARSKMVAAELSPEKQAMLMEVCHCIDHILAGRCSAREREAFTSKYLDGLSSKAIAESMNTTNGAVNMLTYSARQKLKEGLEKDGFTLESLLDVLEF